MNIFGQTLVSCISRHFYVLKIFQSYLKTTLDSKELRVLLFINWGAGLGIVKVFLIIYGSNDIVYVVMILNFGQPMLDHLTFGQITQCCVNEYFWPDTSFQHFPPLFCPQNISIGYKHYFRLKRVACFAIFKGVGQGLVEVFIKYGSNDIVDFVMVLNFGHMMLDHLTFGQIRQCSVNEYFWPDTSFLHLPPLFVLKITFKHYFRV